MLPCSDGDSDGDGDGDGILDDIDYWSEQGAHRESNRSLGQSLTEVECLQSDINPLCTSAVHTAHCTQAHNTKDGTMYARQ